MVVTRPNIYFLCMHKAASTFVADVLFSSIARRTTSYELYQLGSFLIRHLRQQQELAAEEAMRSPPDRQQQLLQFLQENPLPESNGLIARLYPGHMLALENYLGRALPNPDSKLMIMRRDPRDALVSLYYSLSISHSVDGIEGDHTTFLEKRAHLQNKDIREGLKCLLDKRGGDSTIPEFTHCTNLILSNSHVCDLPYELLISDPHLWLAKFIEFAELDDIVDEDWIEAMVEHLKPPEIEDPTSHKRRMRPGNWVDVFDDELKQMLQDRLGDRLELFGYFW